jgi:pyrroloquinoline-quinone synthase
MYAFDDFVAQLEAARTPRGSAKHPFSDVWAKGELSKEQLGEWAIQHFNYIDAVPQQFSALHSRMPDAEGRRLLMENLLGEEMVDAPERSHPNLLLDFAEACGLDRAYVERAEEHGLVLPSTCGMRSWIWELATRRTMAEAFAGIMVALEGQLPTLYPPYIDAMRDMGFTDEQLEFFHVHVENDVEHARVGLELCFKYAETDQLQKLAINAVKMSASLRFRMLDDIYDQVVVQRQAAA